MKKSRFKIPLYYYIYEIYSRARKKIQKSVALYLKVCYYLKGSLAMMCEVAGTPKFVVIDGVSEVLARSKSKPEN